MHKYLEHSGVHTYVRIHLLSLCGQNSCLSAFKLLPLGRQKDPMGDFKTLPQVDWGFSLAMDSCVKNNRNQQEPDRTAALPAVRF